MLLAYSMNLREIFIFNLKKYRKENALSQMKLAEKCNTSTSYIGEIEIGRKFPSIEMIETICNALKIKPYQLFLEEDDYIIEQINPEKKEILINNLQFLIKKAIQEFEI